VNGFSNALAGAAEMAAWRASSVERSTLHRRIIVTANLPGSCFLEARQNWAH